METREVEFNKKKYEVDYDPDKDQVVVELGTPLKTGESEVQTEIRINNPSWEQLDSIDLSKLAMPDMRKMASKLSGIPSKLLGSLKGKDILKVIAGVAYFLQESLTSEA